MSTLPINADGSLVDGKAERLPKQLSRHLFPEDHDKKVRQILDEAVWDCLEDATPPLPSIPRARSSPSDKRPTEANTQSRRSVDARQRPGPMPHRSRTYDRGSTRIEPHPTRLSRAISDAGSMPRHRDLPPPPMGRYPTTQRQRSPPPVNRYSASLPAISQHLPSPGPSARSPSFSSDIRGGEGNYGVYSGRERSDERDESPRSPGFGRRGTGSDRGPTWEEMCARSGRGGSVDAGSQRSFR